MDLKPIPHHENTVDILYENVSDERFYCPFCGVETISYINGTFEHTACEHLICASAEGVVLTVSDLFLRHLQDLVPTVTHEAACDKGVIPWSMVDGTNVSVATDNFTGIVPNSLTIRTFNTGNGEEVAVSYAPVVVGAALPIPKSLARNTLQ